jgi:hypothetical protein
MRRGQIAGITEIDPRHSSQVFGQGLRKERQPQQFSCDLAFRPLWMFLQDTRFGKRPREQTHLQCQEKTLFFGHCPVDLKLNGQRFRACIGDGYEQDVITAGFLPAARDCADNQKRFLPRRNRLRQRRIR